MRLPSKQQVQKCGNKENHRKHNSRDVKRSLNATARAVHTAIAAKCKAGIGSTSLEKNGATQEHTKDKEKNIQNHIVPSVPKHPLPVKQPIKKAMVYFFYMEGVPVRSFSYTKVLVTLLFVLVAASAFAFAWKIFGYYQDFRSGELVPIASYKSTQATAARLASLARTSEGSGELATTDDPQFGPADAPITIVAFTDFGCPYSQEESYVLEGITHNTNDNVRVILRDFPLTDLHPGADKAAIAGECAAEQGKYTEMYRVLNKTSGEFTEENLLQSALDAGLDRAAYLQCMSSGFYEDEVSADVADGIAAGVTSTPTLFVNGVKIEGAIPYGILYEAVQSLAE